MWVVIIYFIIYCCILNLFLEKHILSVLLRLEFILITIFLILIIKNYIILSLLIISLGACEGALGLSLLINLSSCKNKFFINSYRIIKC